MPMDRHFELLLEIKDEIGAMRGEVGEIKGSLQSRPCEAHADNIQKLNARFNQVTEVEIPAIRQQLAVRAWFVSGRSKFAAVLCAIVIAVSSGVISTWFIGKVDQPPQIQTTIEVDTHE